MRSASASVKPTDCANSTDSSTLRRDRSTSLYKDSRPMARMTHAAPRARRRSILFGMFLFLNGGALGARSLFEMLVPCQQLSEPEELLQEHVAVDGPHH